MSTKSLENFFSGKTLTIPSYQRDYAWERRNVDDLFSDVEEALDSGGGHYLGTFILSQPHLSAQAQVVDGQQRLTTLTMLLNALVSVLDEPEVQQHYRNLFIRSPVTGIKFQVLGDNKQFFGDMLARVPVTPVSDGQERLLDAYQWISQRVKALCSKDGQEAVKKWLQCISLMEVMEFVEPNEGKAIRMFQSVNDRGVPLARMDIVKSLLVYYSNRYLDAELDDHIAQQFGKAFRSFNRIKRLARDAACRVDLIARDTFREDDVLRYHYLAFHDNSGAGVPATRAGGCRGLVNFKLSRFSLDTLVSVLLRTGKNVGLRRSCLGTSNIGFTAPHPTSHPNDRERRPRCRRPSEA
jgi:hypothetical protein